MLSHPLPPSTHTLEQSQLAEINALLAVEGRNRVTAGELGLTDRPACDLPASALLTRLTYEGPPEFPYIHGHFLLSKWREAPLAVEMNSEALKILSRRLGLRHRWSM